MKQSYIVNQYQYPGFFKTMPPANYPFMNVNLNQPRYDLYMESAAAAAPPPTMDESSNRFDSAWQDTNMNPLNYKLHESSCDSAVLYTCNNFVFFNLFLVLCACWIVPLILCGISVSSYVNSFFELFQSSFWEEETQNTLSLCVISTYHIYRTRLRLWFGWAQIS